MHSEPIKNKEKPEFDWNTNQSCIDFHLVINNKDNYYYSGSHCYNETEYYNNQHKDEKINDYSINEFKKESRKLVLQFLNRRNKKEYEIDNHLTTMTMKLWNYHTDKYDKIPMDLNLTFCP